MNFEHLFRNDGTRLVRFAVTGAGGAFARTLLAGARHVPNLAPAVLCDLDPDGVLAALGELGLPPGRLCTTAEEATTAFREGGIAVVRDHRLLGAVPHDIVVEATGQPEFGAHIALDAFARGADVAMISKECDSVVGPHLNAVATAKGLVYTTADGDQPANLIGLVSWARLLGFEVVAAGKSSEYDFVFDPERETVTCLDGTAPAPGLGRLWELGPDVPARIAERAALLSALPQRATPDYCEMNVVANSTGLQPSRDALTFPVCRVAELADVFIPREEGGVLDRSGVVDVFNCLRRPDEASFGGGGFVVVRAADAVTWDILRGKGHLVSRNGRYGCVFLPYHLMGLETPLSLLSAVLHRRPSGSDRQRVHAVMVARAERDFAAGETLHMGGHHHVMRDCTALLLPAANAEGLAPFYLAANKTLGSPVAAGAIIGEQHLMLKGSLLQELRQSKITVL